MPKKKPKDPIKALGVFSLGIKEPYKKRSDIYKERLQKHQKNQSHKPLQII